MNGQKLSCGQAVQRFSAYLDRALEDEALADLEAHLNACLDCCDRLEFSRRLDAVVKSRLDAATLPEGIEARIRRALPAERAWRPGQEDDDALLP